MISVNKAELFYKIKFDLQIDALYFDKLLILNSYDLLYIKDNYYEVLCFFSNIIDFRELLYF